MTDKKQSALHEILAVEADLTGTAKRITEETKHTFREKGTHFQSTHRTLKMVTAGVDQAVTDAAEQAEEQRTEMVTTVHEKLKYTLSQLTPFYDVVLQKEATNQDAIADLIVNGKTIATGLPATFLLGMETKLKSLREIYEVIPTLAPGIRWDKDETVGRNVYRMSQPEVRAKTAKTWQHKVLVAATDKHPAQIEKWEEAVTVGTFTKQAWSSAMTATEKSELLGRIDDLIQAVKQARQRANSVAVRKISIGKALVDYLHPQGL